MSQLWIILTLWSPVVSVPSLAGMCSSVHPPPSPPFHGANIFPSFLPFFSQVKLCRYRRGKPESNDIDIIFTHPSAKSAKNLCGRLVERLRSAGLVTHVMRE